MSEQMQAKFMTLIVREYRKNREYTKIRDQKKFADQHVKQKILSNMQLKPGAAPASSKKSDSPPRKKPEKKPWGARPTQSGSR